MSDPEIFHIDAIDGATFYVGPPDALMPRDGYKSVVLSSHQADELGRHWHNYHFEGMAIYMPSKHTINDLLRLVRRLRR